VVIRRTVTWGVTVLPLKGNLVPRFMKEGVQETMKDVSTVEKEEYWDSWKEEKLLGFPCNFSFHA
jgi:hypothetical protein